MFLPSRQNSNGRCSPSVDLLLSISRLHNIISYKLTKFSTLHDDGITKKQQFIQRGLDEQGICVDESNIC